MESITPEDGATGGLIVAEEGGVEAGAELNTLTENPDHGRIYPQEEVPLPFGTERKVRRAAKAQTLRLFLNGEGAVDLIQILKVKVEENLPVIPDPQTASPAPNRAVHSDGSCVGRSTLGLTNQALDLLTWEKNSGLEGIMKPGPSQDSFLKESLLAEEEEGYTADEVEQGSVVALVRPQLDGHQQESPPLSGPPNPWKPSDLRTLRSPQDTTIHLRIAGPLSLMVGSLGMGLFRVAERGLVDPGQLDPPGKINHLVSDA